MSLLPEICLVTAVSRPENLPKIQRSIVEAHSRSSLRVKWILVVDQLADVSMDRLLSFQKAKHRVQVLLYPDGSSKFGVLQKNFGMGHVKDAFYHCLDDDNIVHPRFFHKIHVAMEENPGKRAFVFGQERWDHTGTLKASRDLMLPGKIDNTMFVVHDSLIGDLRYDYGKAGFEDYYFFRKLYEENAADFVFLDEILSYYNYLRHYP